MMEKFQQNQLLSVPSLYIVEKFQRSSDHPILKYFIHISLDTHFFISFKYLKYYFLIDHHCNIMSETLDSVAFVGIV